MQTLIIVNGPPGSGKTHLGRFLSTSLSLPFICKDGIKELLFDHLGWNTREWSKKLGGASFEILFHTLQSQLETGASCIIETAFFPRFHAGRFLTIKKQFQLEIIQVFCSANASILAQRFKDRVESGERHPGHMDETVTESQFLEMIKGDKYGRLDIGGSCLEIDTSDFSRIDYNDLLHTIQSGLKVTAI